MNKNRFTEIITNRLVLRRLRTSDWEMISYLRSDKNVNKYVKRPGAESKEKALEFISKINKGIDDKSFYYWTITKKNNEIMIGSICLWNFSEDRKTAEIGYDLSPEFQRQGIMNESMEVVLKFGFNKLSLDLIEAFTHRENDSSRKLLERNGFVHNEGKKDDHNVDNVIYERRKKVVKTE